MEGVLLLLSLGLFLGLVAGWLAGGLVKGAGFGLLGGIVRGILGSAIGGAIFGAVGIGEGGLPGQMPVPTAGGILPIFVLRLMRRVQPHSFCPVFRQLSALISMVASLTT